MTILKVSASSNPNAVAGAIYANVRESGCAKLQAIGAGAVNQAAKAIAIAREFCQKTNFDFVCLPEFYTLEIDAKECTAIRFSVRPVRRKEKIQETTWNQDTTSMKNTA